MTVATNLWPARTRRCILQESDTKLDLRRTVSASVGVQYEETSNHAIMERLVKEVSVLNADATNVEDVAIILSDLEACKGGTAAVDRMVVRRA